MDVVVAIWLHIGISSRNMAPCQLLTIPIMEVKANVITILTIFMEK